MFMDRKIQYGQDISPSQFDLCNAIPIKIPASYFVDIDNLIKKFIWKSKRPE